MCPFKTNFSPVTSSIPAVFSTTVAPSKSPTDSTNCSCISNKSSAETSPASYAFWTAAASAIKSAAFSSTALSSESDCNSLKEGLIDGTIDYLTSMHEPYDIDHKRVVFDDASPGSIGLESIFGLMCNQFTLEKSIDILTRRKMIFEIDDHSIEVGSKANLTLFNPDKNYQFSDKHILSSSKNCAFVGSKLKGVVYGSINGDKFTLNKLWT